jgi:hypothetical protein
MTAMGLRLMKLLVKVNDSNGLEVEEIAGQDQCQQWARGGDNCQSRPMTAMGLRRRRLPDRADDSNDLETGKIDDWSQQWQ